MNPDNDAAESDSILIVEPDADLLNTFTTYFDSTGDFKYHIVSRGGEVLAAVLKHRPKLILMEIRLPDIPGLSVFQELRDHPRAAHIPVIFLAGGTAVLLQKEALQAGAYDFVPKPVDVAELSLRIRNSLRHQDGQLHPETRLPVGEMVTETVENLTRQARYYLLRLSIQEFDSFKDVYGFVAASEVLIHAGNVIGDVVAELGSAKDFIGHESDSRFVIITSPEQGPKILTQLTERLNGQLPQFYNFMDRDQGYIESADGSQKPLMQVQTEVTQSE